MSTVVSRAEHFNVEVSKRGEGKVAVWVNFTMPGSRPRYSAYIGLYAEHGIPEFVYDVSSICRGWAIGKGVDVVQVLASDLINLFNSVLEAEEGATEHKDY